jgi:dTDP-4-amino-4,6-dideoxygalactose transaminase
VDRDGLRAYLGERGIGTEVYYPVPLHLQQSLAGLGHVAGEFPASEAAAGEVLALPIFPELDTASQQTVVDAVAAYVRSGSRARGPKSPAGAGG